jgi:hypothetical protein
MAVLVEGRPKSEVASEYGVSRRWVITLVQRYSGFALRQKDWRESGCTMRLAPNAEADASLASLRSFVLAALLVVAAVSMVALAPSRSDAVRRR